MTDKQDNRTNQSRDPGAHYSYMLGDTILDPYKIAAIYNMTSFPLMTVLKKILVCGNRGYKDYKQDIRDCIKALDRELELLDEEKTND